MDDAARQRFRKMVDSYHDRDDPTGWFDSVYQDAGGDPEAVFWSDRAPSPHLVSWMKDLPAERSGLRAIVIGCGIGDDAEAIAIGGYQVIAFDIAPAAIRMCRERYPDSAVNYRVADLFSHPAEWSGAFDLVFECNTIQALPGKYRSQALDAIAGMAAPGGAVLVSCRNRNTGERDDEFPLPLNRHEIDGFVRAGLIEHGFEEYDDEQDPPVPHVFAWYRRPEESP